MSETANISTILVVTAIVLFFALGIAIMVIIDHKARLPGGFTENPFSIIGMRRDHPVIAFLTTVILFAIMAALIVEMAVALAGALGFKSAEPVGLVAKLRTERTSERLRHFHHYPPEQYPLKGEKTVCFVCHGDFPHSKEPMVRSLLNMHTQFIGCMTCHNDSSKVAESSLRFQWLNFSGITPTGKPYGTEVDPKLGTLLATDDYYSKIVAYTRDGAAEQLLEITMRDHPEAQEFARIRDKLSDQDREAVKKQFHRLVASKGRLCSRCHTEEARSYLPLRQLGFSDRRVRDLTHLNIIGLVEKYKEFHTPSLSKVQRGPAAPAPAAPVGEDMRKDPRSWWKDTYDAPRPAAPTP